MRNIRVDRPNAELAHVVLSRPERHNALMPDMWQDLARIGGELTDDPAIKVVVVSGEGASFCSGIDRRALADGALTPYGFTGEERDRVRTDYEERDIVAAQATSRWLMEADFVTIAAVRGFALGAGAQIAMACDMRIVGDDTTFSLPEVTIGLFPEMSAVAVLPRLVGYAKAIELALTGDKIDAAQALELGLANHVVAPDEVLEVAQALAAKLAKARPDAIRYCKRAMRRGVMGDIGGALATAREGGLKLLQDIQAYWQWEREKTRTGS